MRHKKKHSQIIRSSLAPVCFCECSITLFLQLTKTSAIQVFELSESHVNPKAVCIAISTERAVEKLDRDNKKTVKKVDRKVERRRDIESQKEIEKRRKRAREGGGKVISN